MNAIGSYKYPSIQLNRAIEIVKVIAYDFGGSVNRSTLASKLNLSPSGVQFSKVVNGCKEWNLIHGRTNISLTEYGLIVSNPQNIEENHSIKLKIIRSIDIFNDFINNFPEIDIRDPNFHIYLQQITGVSRLEIDSSFKFLKPLFSEVINILNENKSYFNTDNINQNQSLLSDVKIDQQNISSNYIQIIFRDVNVKMPDTNESIEAIIALLRAHKSG